MSKFDEQDFLHQTITKDSDGKLNHYRDLLNALESDKNFQELRTHFHVPIFVKDYGLLSSTQEDIIKVLKLIQQQFVTDMLEVETYTWDILPTDLKLELNESVVRELKWVKDTFRA